MPYCQECGKWEPPPRPFETGVHEWLRIAFHSRNCPERLKDEEGSLDGYQFSGDILYEIQKDGKWIPVCTFHEFPRPIAGTTEVGKPPEVPEVIQALDMVETEPERHDMKRIALEAYTWEEWSKKYPGYARSAQSRLENNTSPYRSQTHFNQSSYKPEPKYFDQIDKKKWPNTWKWSFRFYFAPDFQKNTRYKYVQGEYGYTPNNYGPYGMD